MHMLVQQIPLTSLLYYPISGKTFKKIEVINIMLNVSVKKHHIRGATLKAILVHQKHYYVSCSKPSVYRFLANHAYGIVISGELLGKGQPPICSDTDMKPIAELLEIVGRSKKMYNKSDVKW